MSKHQVITLPNEFYPYDYQKPVWRAFFDKGIKRLVLVWPRRAGKDDTSLNIMVTAAMQKKGVYYYIFPTLVHAKSVIWEGMTDDAVAFIDRIPRQLIKSINNTELKVTLINGSIIRLRASDQYHKLRGTNPIGVILSEYSMSAPMVWEEVISPILLKNKGWIIFVYTPLGQNHGYELYNMAKTNPKWFCEKLTIEQLFDHDGERIYSDDDIKEELLAGRPESLIQQEYYCNFEAFQMGTYYTKFLHQLDERGDICDFEYDRNLGVFTAWDIGHNDPTAIWFFQLFNGKVILIHYYENRLEQIQHYIEYINEYRAKNNIAYIKHFAPHDAANTYTIGSVTTMAARLGLTFDVIPRTDDIKYDIALTQGFLAKCRFHKTNTKRGLDCLREYHQAYNDALDVFSEYPVHNWASHGADAFRYVRAAVEDHIMNPRPPIGRPIGRVLGR